MDLRLLKMHLRVDHDFEDDLIEEYQRWAEEEVKDSVTTELLRDEAFFTDNPHFNRAVVLLVGHFFENRIGITDASRASGFNDLPDGILSAIQKLRGSYVSLNEVIS